MALTTQNSPDAVAGEEYDYEALPEGYGLSHNMMAGAFAGIAEHTVMYPVDLMKVNNSSSTHRDRTLTNTN